MESVDAYPLGRLLEECLRSRSGLDQDKWHEACSGGRIPGSKLLADQADVSLRTLGRALRATKKDGLRIRLSFADRLLMAAGYGPEALHEVEPLELPDWAYGISEDCLHVDPAWGI